MKRIAVLTSGGDAPGMNCAIRSVVRAGLAGGFEVFGVMRGFRGLFENDFLPLDARKASGLINSGGTFLRTIRFPELKNRDVRETCLKNLAGYRIDCLVVIGGDGSGRGAEKLSGEHGFPVVFIPASIDNDVAGTDFTVGFDTAVNTAIDAIDRIRDTATSHERIFVVEVMGREHGFLALAIGITAGAEIILLPEFPVDWDKIIATLEHDRRRGKLSTLVVVAEGAGKAHEVSGKIQDLLPGREVRYSVLGYVQRGGRPSYYSRFLATLMGYETVEMCKEGDFGKMAGVRGDAIVRVPLAEVVAGKKTVSAEQLKIFETMAT